MPKFRVSYRATVTARVTGTIKAKSEDEAREKVAQGDMLDNEDVDYDGIDGPSSMDFDCEEVSDES